MFGDTSTALRFNYYLFPPVISSIVEGGRVSPLYSRLLRQQQQGRISSNGGCHTTHTDSRGITGA